MRAEGLHVVEIVGEALSFPQLQRLTAAPIKASRERLKRGARDLSAPTRTPLEFGKDAFGRCIG
ncbi:MAG: hypothetical protein RML56_10555 [Burkholderiales bacterium]|nr:hypothetical protein [Burkholderiales bacterium]